MGVIIENGLVRVLSFQSREVLEVLKEQAIYYADIDKCREHRSYTRDIEQLGGYNPIWGFAFSERHDREFWYKSMLETFRCELSLHKRTLADFVCLELFIPKDLVKIGLTHNACDFAVVFPYLTADMIHQVYNFEIEELDFGTEYKFKLPVVNSLAIYKYSYQPTFELGFRILTAEEFDEYEDVIPNDFPLLSPQTLKNRKVKLCSN